MNTLRLSLFFLSLVILCGPRFATAEELTNIPLTVLIPIPSYGFDPTETAVPWKYLKTAGYKVVFATPAGKPGAADARMATGKDLGILKSILMNDANGVAAYNELLSSPEFNNPIAYQEIKSQSFDALLLPGGHDKGMKEYLGSPLIQKVISEFFAADKPVGAICHGTLVVGRSKSIATGQSVLFGRKTTGLTRNQELTAYTITKLSLGDYYRTYPELDTQDKTITMADELKSYLKSSEDFQNGPGFPIPLKRDSPNDLEAGFVVIDGNYLSARWPGDAHRFGSEFVNLLKRYAQSGAKKKVYFLPLPNRFGGKVLFLRVGEYLPPQAPKGDILYFPGFADRFDNHEPLFAEYNRKGFRVLSFDYPSHGETYGSANWLDYFSFSDLSAMSQFVIMKTQAEVSRPLMLVGWSTGGLLATRMLQTNAFAKIHRQPKGVVLFAPGIAVRTVVGEYGVVTERSLTHNQKPPHLGKIKPLSPFTHPLFAANLLLNSKLAQAGTLPTNLPILVIIGGENEDRYVKTQEVMDWVLNQQQHKMNIFGFRCPHAAHEIDNEPNNLGGNEIRLSSAQFLNQALETEISSAKLIDKYVCNSF